MMHGLVNLHTISELKDIYVREGISLRPLENSVATRILEILDDDPDIRKRVAVAKTIYTKEDVSKEVESSQSDPDLIRYSVIKNDRCIGLVSFWRLGDYIGKNSPEPYTFGFGYFLDPAERGNGIISSALLALMKVVRIVLQPKNFIAFCEDDNPASIAVLQKCGFTATDEIVYFPEVDWHERKYIIKV